MARLLCTIDEPLRQPDGRMAGLQVRVHEMASALVRAGHEVVVAAEASPAPSATPYEVRSLHDVGALGRFDAWITHPRLVARLLPRLAGAALIVDGYESPFGSFLAQAASLLPRLGPRVTADYRATIAGFLDAIERADLVLCATESQRISYLTLLAALGRIGPRHPEPDLVLEVCSGCPPGRPARADDRSRPPTLLWAGGCYPWFDVDTLLAALPLVVERVPDVEIVFAGIGGVADDGAGGSDLPGTGRIRDAIECSPSLRGRTRRVAWLPYAERGAVYAGADVGVCTYGDHLETSLAMRTRVIDMAWGGLPQIVSAGDALGELAEREGAGAVVPPADPSALAECAVWLLTDTGARARMSDRAFAWAAGTLGWDARIAPLATWCTRLAAGGVVRPERISAGERILRPNTGVGRRLADGLGIVGRRAANVWRRTRTRPLGPEVTT